MGFLDHAKESAEQFAKQARPAAQRAREKAGPMLAQVREKAEQARQKAGPMLAQAREKAGQAAKNLKQSAGSFREGYTGDKDKPTP